LADQDKYCQ